MAAYNDRHHVSIAVDSVLDQSFPDFEFVVVDDGADDGTSVVLDGYDDDRLTVLRNKRNQRISAATNRCLAGCSDRIIARMDADDRAHPDRLERQLSFFDGHSGIDLLGGHERVIEGDGRPIGYYDYPKTDLEIRWTALFNCPFGHPTVAFRRTLLDELEYWYDESYSVAVDYELWPRVLRHAQAANLPEPLIDYRVHDGSVTARYDDQQRRKHVRIARRTMSEWLPAVSISSDRHAPLIAWFQKGDDFVDSSVPSRLELAEAYLRIFDAFARKHRDSPGSEPSNGRSSPTSRRRCSRVDRGWPPSGSCSNSCDGVQGGRSTGSATSSRFDWGSSASENAGTGPRFRIPTPVRSTPAVSNEGLRRHASALLTTQEATGTVYETGDWYSQHVTMHDGRKP